MTGLGHGPRPRAKCWPSAGKCRALSPSGPCGPSRNIHLRIRDTLLPYTRHASQVRRHPRKTMVRFAWQSIKGAPVVSVKTPPLNHPRGCSPYESHAVAQCEAFVRPLIHCRLKSCLSDRHMADSANRPANMLRVSIPQFDAVTHVGDVM